MKNIIRTEKKCLFELSARDQNEIPFDPMIPILAALLKEINSRDNKAECFSKVRTWYWSAVFTNSYSSAVDSQLTADFKEMREWFDSDTKVPRTVNQMRSELCIVSQHWTLRS